MQAVSFWPKEVESWLNGELVLQNWIGVGSLVDFTLPRLKGVLN